MNPTDQEWPALPNEEWSDTRDALHLWTQVVGKIRLVQTPWINHSWHVTLYVTPRGLTTGSMPHGRRSFQMDFDFVDHRLDIVTSDGQTGHVPLRSQSVVDFYVAVMAQLDAFGLTVQIHTTPNEITDVVPFEDDDAQRPYDPEAVDRFRRALIQADRVFTRFRAGFRGKCSPVHFFWGSFDMAVTRFSGRTAPEHPGGFPNLPDWVTREAYSHEVSSAGFWPGDAGSPPLFYSYAYPTPEGFAQATVRPSAAFFYEDLGEFALPYEAVRTASDPEGELMAFLESTYAVAADLADWDRDALEMQAEYPPY